MTFSGWLATLTGWYVAEMGRQPWLVFGVLTTAQAAAPIPTPLLATTLAAYFTLYALLISAYISVVFYLARKAQHGTSDVTLASPISGIGPARAST